MTDDHGTQYVGVGDKVSGVVGIMGSFASPFSAPASSYYLLESMR
jgi:hypothetical protein